MSGSMSAASASLTTRYFNQNFYLQSNADVFSAFIKGGFSPLQHFINGGFREDRNPFANFDTKGYLLNNPDVQTAVSQGRTTAWEHFVNGGITENRSNGQFAGFFNEAAYLAANSDVAAAVKAGSLRSGYEHWLNGGVNEGRQAFNTAGAPISAGVGTTFTLTTNADNFPGTLSNSSNDLITGVVGAGATLSAADVVNGGTGIDTLSIAATLGATSVTAGALITNVEIVNVRGAGTDFADALTLDGTGLPLQQIGLTGSFDANLNGVGSSFTASNVAAPIQLNLTGATGLGAVAINGTGATTVTINSTSAANTMGGFTAANASTLNIVAATNLTATGVTMLTGGTAGVVNVSGAAALVALGALGTTVGTVNASTLTAGGITASLGSATQKITGGAGQDIITTNGIVLGTGSVDAGTTSLTDRLVVSATADLTAVTGAKYTNFEQLQAENGVTANASFLTGITDIRINDGGAATGVIGLTAAQAGKIAIINANPAGAITIGLTDSSGSSDAVVAAVTNSTSAGAAQNMDLTAMSLAGIESLTLNTNGTTAANSGVLTLTTTDAVALTSITYTNAGDTQLTIGATHTGASLVINGAASAGTSTINVAGYIGGTAAQAITINSGGGVDNITGSTARINTINSGAGNDLVIGGGLNDVINLGDGNDVTNGGAGADSIQTGSGNDTVRITSLVETQGAGFAAANTSYANVDRITDFAGNGAAVGDGFLLNGAANVFGGALDFTTTTVAVVTAVTVATAADFTALAAAVQLLSAGVASTNAVAQVYDVTVTSGNLAGRVMILNDDTAGIAATDTFIGMTGITGALNTQDFTFSA